jgi:PHS family inorganic phosphate transporter-like MFS transporter
MKVVLPSVAFSNWKSGDIGKNELKINIAILAGSIIGQLLFGHLADRNGRLKLYGYYFIALTYVNVCFAHRSSGYDSMSMMTWLTLWGFFAGICTGAGNPLIATTTAE